MSDELLLGDDQEEELPTRFEVPIEWYTPPDLPTQYITNMTLQRTEHEFIVSFFEQRMPILLGPPEQIREQVKGIESIRATCVARLVIANGRFGDIVEVLHRALENYRAAEAGEEEEEKKEGEQS